ncbi:MAG: hypothetical protein AAB649_06485 [Patescibacteria group bacterium]
MRPIQIYMHCGLAIMTAIVAFIVASVATPILALCIVAPIVWVLGINCSLGEALFIATLLVAVLFSAVTWSALKRAAVIRNVETPGMIYAWFVGSTLGPLLSWAFFIALFE